MRTRILLLMLACLGLAGTAEAGTAWVGAQVHFPVPARDVGDDQLGVDAGLTLTWMYNANVGLGGDLVYHYWPASAGYEGAFDRYLRSARFESLEGSSWAFTAFQVTGHVRFEAPAWQRLAPWAQVGLGAYRLNRNLDERRPAGTYAYVIGPSLGNVTVAPGWYGTIGLDFHHSAPVVPGLEATFHYLWSHANPPYGGSALPNFSAFTVGAHVSFGW